MTCLLRCSKAALASMPQPAGATRLSCISHHLPALKKCNICACTPLLEATQNASRCPTYSRAPATPKSLEFRFFSATAPIPACNRITTATLPFTRCTLTLYHRSSSSSSSSPYLLQAVREGHLDIVQLLLTQGADPAVINVAGDSLFVTLFAPHPPTSIVQSYQSSLFHTLCRLELQRAC